MILLICQALPTAQSVYAARKLVARLYDQKEKLKAGHVDLNKLRVRLATLLKNACLAKLPPLRSNLPEAYIESVVTDQHLDVCTQQNRLRDSSFIWMGEEESVSSSVFQRSDVV